MFQSLVRGPDAMEERIIIQNKFIKSKNIVRTQKYHVIDVKQEFRGSDIMKIGHSNKQSETFLPTFFQEPDSKITFTDVAGQKDTRGELIELINQLLIK